MVWMQWYDIECNDMLYWWDGSATDNPCGNVNTTADVIDIEVNVTVNVNVNANTNVNVNLNANVECPCSMLTLNVND